MIPIGTLVKRNANNDHAEKAWGTTTHQTVLKLTSLGAAVKMNKGIRAFVEIRSVVKTNYRGKCSVKVYLSQVLKK